VEQFKRTFDSPNRARIAMQKLHSYTQSPQQDIRSFCSEMRKLFLEADPEMSSTMKLELLLAKVHPSYRFDLLKQKPKDVDDFELMAKDLENTYLVLDAIEQNVQSTNSFPPTPTRSATTTYSGSSFQRHQRPSYNPSEQYDYRSYNSSHYSSQPPSSTSATRSYAPTSSTFLRRPFQPRSVRGSNTPRQNLFVVQPSPSSSATIQFSPSSEGPPPLMSVPAANVFTTSPPATSSSPTHAIRCQFCFTEGHSARACPF
jgi:hypothetical protein